MAGIDSFVPHYLFIVNDVFEVPTNDDVHFHYRRHGNMAGVIDTGRTDDLRIQVFTSQRLGLGRRCDPLDSGVVDLSQSATNGFGANLNSSSVTSDMTSRNVPSRTCSKNRKLGASNSLSKHPPNTDVSA